MSNDMERERFKAWFASAYPDTTALQAALQVTSVRNLMLAAWQAARATPVEPPTEPPPGLLMSMAIRYDHGLCMPGYYDSLPIQLGPSHAQRLESTLMVMRQLWEEVIGRGCYNPAFEAAYAQMARAAAPSAPSDQQGGRT